MQYVIKTPLREIVSLEDNLGSWAARLCISNGDRGGHGGSRITSFVSSPHPLLRKHPCCEPVFLLKVSVERFDRIALDPCLQGQVDNIDVQSSWA